MEVGTLVVTRMILFVNTIPVFISRGSLQFIPNLFTIFIKITVQLCLYTNNVFVLFSFRRHHAERIREEESSISTAIPSKRQKPR